MKNKIYLYLIIEITKEEKFQSFKTIFILVNEYMNNKHKIIVLVMYWISSMMKIIYQLELKIKIQNYIRLGKNMFLKNYLKVMLENFICNDEVK